MPNVLEIDYGRNVVIAVDQAKTLSESDAVKSIEKGRK